MLAAISKTEAAQADRSLPLPFPPEPNSSLLSRLSASLCASAFPSPASASNAFACPILPFGLQTDNLLSLCQTNSKLSASHPLPHAVSSQHERHHPTTRPLAPRPNPPRGRRRPILLLFRYGPPGPRHRKPTPSLRVHPNPRRAGIPTSPRQTPMGHRHPRGVPRRRFAARRPHCHPAQTPERSALARIPPPCEHQPPNHQTPARIARESRESNLGNADNANDSDRRGFKPARRRAGQERSAGCLRRKNAERGNSERTNNDRRESSIRSTRERSGG